MTTPAGWYPDPEQPGVKRYFDGQQWTQHRNAPPSAPQGSRLRGLLTLFGIVAAIVVLLAGWNFITDKHGGLSSLTDARVGESVTDGKFQFTVSNVLDSTATTPRPRGRWVIATMDVVNTGREPQSFFVQNQKLIDTSGREYAGRFDGRLLVQRRRRDGPRPWPGILVDGEGAVRRPRRF
jgi:hypothetical protein